MTGKDNSLFKKGLLQRFDQQRIVAHWYLRNGLVTNFSVGNSTYGLSKQKCGESFRDFSSDSPTLELKTIAETLLGLYTIGTNARHLLSANDSKTNFKVRQVRSL